MNWLEFFKTLISDGWMGINIWYLILAFIFSGLIFSNWKHLKMSFRPRYWRRRYMCRFSKGIKCEIDLPPLSEDVDQEDLRNVHDAIMEGVERYCDKFDAENPLKELE